MSRIIGIRHRVKQRADQSASPTQVCVVKIGDSYQSYNLETETDELDWLLGQFPTRWRLAIKVSDEKQVRDFASGRRTHHLRWRKLRSKENPLTLSSTHFVEVQKNIPHILEIPAELDGLRRDDIVCICLGGSGDRLAFALSRQAEELQGRTQVLRIKPDTLKQRRILAGEFSKNQDPHLLTELFRTSPTDFFSTTRRDRDLIRLKECWNSRLDAMKARIGAEQRLRSHLIGMIFCSEEGKYPEGQIERLYEQQRSNDTIITALEKEEAARNAELQGLLNQLEVYRTLLKPVRGIGPMIAARLIVTIEDIRRFENPAKLKAYLGAHVLRGGLNGEPEPRYQFPRQRTGTVANWHPEGRQALFLLADQFNRNPDSEWGQRLRSYKTTFRDKHGHGSPLSVRKGLVDAYRTAEQWLLEAGHQNPIPVHGTLETREDFHQWITQCLADITEQNRELRTEVTLLANVPILQERIDQLTLQENGNMVTVYSNAHIHKMASWRTVTKFVEWLWHAWTHHHHDT